MGQVSLRAIRKSYDAIKSGPGDFPLGSCVAMGDWWSPEGSEQMLAGAPGLNRENVRSVFYGHEHLRGETDVFERH